VRSNRWLASFCTSGSAAHRRLFVLAVVVAYAHSMAIASEVPVSQMKGTVVHVDDGDTVDLLDANHDQHRVRLASIDAPELSHERQEAGRVGQPFADRARVYLSQLVMGRVVEATCPDVDRYGRLVCDLGIDGASANRAMVRAGLAWANMAAGGRYMRDPAMLQLQADARAARAGLWSDANPTAPWEWRRLCWEEGQCDIDNGNRR